MKENDRRWRDDATINNWVLPFVAPWPLRLPIVRAMRAVWHSIQTERHYRRWSMIGSLARSGYDEWVIYAVARGWA